MMNATREKTRLWLLILVGVVATLIGQTHAREIFAPSPHESGIFATQTPASTGEIYDGFRYDAPDSSLAANTGGGVTRVGRWMSQAENDAMVAAGRMQESTSLRGVTSVTSPPNAATWARQTEGTIFTEFNVPSEVVRGGGSKIYGPNSIFGPKLGITEMPPATNIIQTSSKWPR